MKPITLHIDAVASLEPCERYSGRYLELRATMTPAQIETAARVLIGAMPTEAAAKLLDELQAVAA